MMGKDDPWKRVCSNSENDPGGPYCTDAANTKGNPSVVPANPADLNGPKGYSELPRPIIGCSRIDPTLHGMQFDTCAGIAGTTKALFAQPAVGVQTGIVAPGYPAYPAVPAAPAPGTSTNPYLVLMGEDPTISTKAGVAKTCHNGVDALGNPITYFGYFDCALSTYCDPGEGPCPGGVLRKGCLRPTDTRVIVGHADEDSAHYVAPIRNGTPGVEAGNVTTSCSAAGGTGMVFTGDQNFINNLSSGGRPITLYVQHNPATPGVAGIPSVGIGPQDMLLIGTLVAEGAIESKNKAEICTGGPQATAPANNCSVAVTATGSAVAYGYPLAILAYDPKLPYPTVSPQAPQEFEVDFGSNNTKINGSVYVAGELTFNPINVNGSSIAYDIDLQSSTSSYRYMDAYGVASPPPGFMSSAGIATMILKSFIVCTTFGSETTSAAAGGLCQ
jgi:hypothetical protein